MILCQDQRTFTPILRYPPDVLSVQQIRVKDIRMPRTVFMILRNMLPILLNQDNSGNGISPSFYSIFLKWKIILQSHPKNCG